MSRILLVLLFCTPLLASAQTQNLSGTLSDGDPVREYGGAYDAFTVDLQAGQQVTVRMESDAFDTYLVLRGPGGMEEANDDFEGTTVSQIETVVAKAGTYSVWASSFSESGRGDYTLTITPGNVAQIEIIEGRLDPRDEQLPKGEYADRIERTINAASPFSVELESYGFDGFLVVRAPDGQMWRNDDSGSTSSSRLADLPPMAGTWTIWATTLNADEVGAYDLRILTFD